jgi:hypothetical protein
MVGSNQVVQTTTKARIAVENAMSRNVVFIVCASTLEDNRNERGEQCREVGKNSKRMTRLAGVATSQNVVKGLSCFLWLSRASAVRPSALISFATVLKRNDK